MDNLLFCLNATVPIFSLMALGYFLRKLNFFHDDFILTANKFVFSVSLPVLLFQDMAATDFLSDLDGTFILFCAVTTFICIGIAFLVSLLFKKNYSQGEFIQAAYRSSAAILGIALIQNIYGTTGMVSQMLIASVPIYNIMAVVILEFFKPNQEPFNKKIVLNACKGVIKNPILIGLLLGILWSLLKIPVPKMLDKSLTYIANLATPLGFMAMGAAFNFKKALGCFKPAIVCTILKLFAFVALFMPLAIALGFRESHLIAILIMLGSSTTISGFIMAKNMGHDGVLSSSVITLTTFLSSFTLTFWLFILKTGGFI